MRLFVYGTLLPEFETHRYISPYIVGTAFPGRVRGRLVDVGAYPALIPAKGSEPPSSPSHAPFSFVRGMWFEITREGLARADEYEEFYGIEESNDYERIRMTDADRPDVSGWVYVWTDDRGFPPAGVDWWPDKTKD
ncbi:gamma-glutamylcyclotransferase family protein [Cohnella thailandensis]|uniref:gamma-glutamylcyclotransferase family protein n=1 Tax=Cohnella thailandensis TaxID=557557 RepID=UPI001D82FAD3|nr:gamma-glutamylcyclotransferase family protein [Cohnella thailandensis]MBP1976460.1 gamma-glutamylcyclotransferase (GGCT)/AIG2-like uncharacterized protein YtfP [Cohnella thailandensis]